MRRFWTAGAVAFVLVSAGAALAAASKWSIRSTPNPTGAQESSLSGLWCTSARACTAVGSYEKGLFPSSS